MRSLNFNYLSRLDHLRFFACLLVCFHHFRGQAINTLHIDTFDGLSLVKKSVQLWLIEGASGVSLFLVLSAFLFTLIANGGTKKIIYHKFIYNRILRIFPLMVTLVFIIITLDRANSTPLDILRIFTLQLNTGNPMTGWGHSVFPSGPIWTIAVEFQFYLLFPILMIFLSKYGYKYFGSLILFVLTIRLGIALLNDYNVYYNLYHSIIGRLDQFLIGIVLAFFYINGSFDKLSNSISLLIFFASLTILSLFFILENKLHSPIVTSVLSFPIEAVCWGGVIISYLKMNIIFPFSNSLDKLFSYLGGLSFSIYLFHLPIGYVVNNLWDIWEPVTLTQSIIYTLIKIPFIILFSMLSYHSIEKPFMELRVKYFK